MPEAFFAACLYAYSSRDLHYHRVIAGGKWEIDFYCVALTPRWAHFLSGVLEETVGLLLLGTVSKTYAIETDGETIGQSSTRDSGISGSTDQIPLDHWLSISQTPSRKDNCVKVCSFCGADKSPINAWFYTVGSDKLGPTGLYYLACYRKTPRPGVCIDCGPTSHTDWRTAPGDKTSKLRRCHICSESSTS
jgi:hypothetical protein